jgi:hypothetical protein
MLDVSCHLAGLDKLEHNNQTQRKPIPMRYLDAEIPDHDILEHQKQLFHHLIPPI